MSLLRRAFFAQASEPARRYGVTFDHLLEHLWRARTGARPIVLRAVRHVDDLVHAAACVRGSSQAWTDLIEQHEAALVRLCRRRLDEIDAVMHVRRLFAELRRGDASEPVWPPLLAMASYIGVQPMRAWLADHAIAMMGRFACALDRSGRPQPIHRAVARRWRGAEGPLARLSDPAAWSRFAPDGDGCDAAEVSFSHPPQRDAGQA